MASTYWVLIHDRVLSFTAPLNKAGYATFLYRLASKGHSVEACTEVGTFRVGSRRVFVSRDEVVLFVAMADICGELIW